MDGAAGAVAGAGAAMERTSGQKVVVAFDIDKRPTRWWSRCSTAV